MKRIQEDLDFDNVMNQRRQLGFKEIHDDTENKETSAAEMSIPVSTTQPLNNHQNDQNHYDLSYNMVE